MVLSERVFIKYPYKKLVSLKKHRVELCFSGEDLQDCLLQIFVIMIACQFQFEKWF
jgi:hypothetical protein